MSWKLSNERNAPNAVRLESTPLGYVLALPFMLGNAEADAWGKNMRAEVLAAIREESEKQLETHPAIEKLKTAQATLAARTNDHNESEARVTELKAKAAAEVEAGGDNLDDRLDKITRQISNERAKQEAIANVLPSLQAAVATAEQAAAAAVRQSTVTTTIHARLLEQRTELIAKLNEIISPIVNELARIERQTDVALLESQTTQSRLQARFAPRTASNAPPLAVKS